MDVLVLWADGTKNVVSSKELKTDKYKRFKVGNKVTMKYEGKLYNGKILAVDEVDSDSDPEEDIPLGKLKKITNFNEDLNVNQNIASSKTCNKNEHQEVQCEAEEKDAFEAYQSPSEKYDPDADPPFGICEVRGCKEEVFTACHRCDKLLCWTHTVEEISNCKYHGQFQRDNITDYPVNLNGNEVQISNKVVDISEWDKPEFFLVDGGPRESNSHKKERLNKSKLAKQLRNAGREYISTSAKKTVPARRIKDRCDAEKCKVMGKQCGQVTEEERRQIFQHYNDLGDLTRQRLFLVRHVEVLPKKRITISKEVSRRQNSRVYYLTVKNNKIIVCKTFFFNTLGIPERTYRTAFSKLNEVGVMEGEKRGGRQRSKECIEKERRDRKEIDAHINRYPQVESHYCRVSTKRMYLHPDLSLRKMYAMFVKEQEAKDCNKIPSFSTYRKVFKAKNLSFLRPKKDQCSLCLTYREGDEVAKNNLKSKYEKHIIEKTLVREKKNESKLRAKEDSSVLCAVFDLQQVIYLPISKESAIFYKSRLSTFNFTFYDVATTQCLCFTWHEASSKRGSAEIATCVYRAISKYSRKGVKTIHLYSDGCYGQNKNSIVASMLLYALGKFTSIEEICLRFFETNHGQNEGDSAHSAISRAMSHAGDLFIPSQLYPVIRFARFKKPYDVIPMNYTDFLDFKALSKELRILSIRESELGNNIRWTNIMEVMVRKNDPMTIFFKYSHQEDHYDSLVLKPRIKGGLSNIDPHPLNAEPAKISKRKYEDLTSLCNGQTPVVRMPEFQQFIFSLPHEA